MSLLARFLVTLLIAGVPAVLAAILVFDEVERTARMERVADRALAFMEEVGRDRAESEPASFGGRLASLRPGRAMRGPGRMRRVARRRPGNPPQLRGPGSRRGDRLEYWAYDAQLRSANPHAPVIPAELAAALRRGEAAAARAEPLEAGSETTGSDEEPGADEPRADRELYQVALRMPWSPDGPASVVLVRSHGAREPPVTADAQWILLAVLGVSMLAIVAAGIPVVRRLRRLSQRIEQSAGELDLELPLRGRCEVRRLEQAFDASRRRIEAQLESLDQRREELRSFVRDTTHDVMLPLSVLQGHLSTARSTLQHDAGGSARSLAAATGEAQYLGSILENLGVFARLGSGVEVVHADFDLRALTERVFERHRTLALARDLELDVMVPSEGPVVVHGDVTLVEQAVSNVVHNAIQYIDPQGRVELRLAVRARRFQLTVRDDGPGMSEAEIARVREPRFRGDTGRSRNPRGGGLGLHIAQQVAERHGYSLVLRSEDGLVVEFDGALATVDAGQSAT